MLPSGDDQLLLRDYALDHSQAAFAELVGRHLDWVYSAALRMVGDPHEAQDVTQAVFVLLSQEPRKAMGKPLAGWLFQVMRYCAANSIRSRRRREKHEMKAATSAANATGNDAPEIWDELSPMLEDLMASLRARDRSVLLLRFYEKKSMVEIGESMSISEEAARKRVGVALDALRGLFRARGVAVPAAVLGTALLAETTRAAPVAVASGIGPAIVAPSSSVLGLVGAVQKILFAAKLKIGALIVLAAVVIPGGAIVVSLLKTPQAPAVAPELSVAVSPKPSKFPLAVTFQPGHADLTSGDSITITDIQGTSATIAPGNSYEVRGTYHLASQQEAVLAIFTTSMVAGGNDNGPYGHNNAPIRAGDGNFTLEFNMRIEGYPHVSFYPAGGGQSFASLYFGSGKYLYTNQPLPTSPHVDAIR
jgi:RNA polymerase sigma factor (sigma-70 family)